MAFCPECGISVLPYTNHCPECGHLLRRPRGFAIDYGKPLVPGPGPSGAIPVPSKHGVMWEPQGFSNSEYRKKEFMARKPPKISPQPRGGKVKIRKDADVIPVEGKGGAAQAARKGSWKGYRIGKNKQGKLIAECPDCGSFSDMHENSLFLCPNCKDWF